MKEKKFTLSNSTSKFFQAFLMLREFTDYYYSAITEEYSESSAEEALNLIFPVQDNIMSFIQSNLIQNSCEKSNINREIIEL